MCDLKLAVSTSALGMDNPLWDSFTIEVGNEIKQVEILKQERSVVDPLILLRTLHGVSIGGGIHQLFGVVITHDEIL